MSQNDSDSDIRSAAELLMNNNRYMVPPRLGGSHYQMPPGFDITRTHSINLITEEFLGGYMQDGRMSVVRRFFCLFVTFDLFFVALLWLICIMIKGENIFQAFQNEIVHYTIYTSLFDVVAAAICRFIVLIVFYALLYINHWFVIALSTSVSCLFLISKVFVFDWVDSRQQVFEVILILTSFVLSWGEAWFLDCRVIPQERHARRYFCALSSSERSPVLAPLLASQSEPRPPESVANFYSPFDSTHHSDDEEQDEEYVQMGLGCVQKAYELLQSSDWKVEKVTSKGDTIQSAQRDKLGKVYKLTGRIKYPAKALMEELFYKIENVPKWNPTLLESKIVQKINTFTDITYQATVGGGGGMVKSRDFVNLRCWRLFRNGKISDNTSESEGSSSDDENLLNRSCEGSVSTISDGESFTPQTSSVGSVRTKFTTFSVDINPNKETSSTLSKSLGAKDFNAPVTPLIPHIDYEPPPLEDEFQDANDNLHESRDDNSLVDQKSSVIVKHKILPMKDKVWISAAISIDYKKVPVTTKYTRGENLITGFAMREIAGKSDACIFEWILCLDLKGYIPRYVLDTALSTFMTDYMTYLRKYVKELRERRIKRCA